MTISGVFKDFYQEVYDQVRETWGLADAPKFITQYTYHRGMRYSFEDHEFQEVIAKDTAQVVNTQKCSQIGLSELTARWTVAVCNMIPDFSAIITFPFSGDAWDFARTRVDPFVRASPRLWAATDEKLNSGEMKRFNNSILYFRGTNGKTQAISIPADLIVSDEIDRSDPHVLSQYHSRLTHSRWKLRRNFSTPTVNGYGIALEMDSSLRHKNMCKCNHCAEWFLPDYFNHVKVPDYDGDLRSITKSNLNKLRWMEAKLLCPFCFAEPDLGPAHREYVVENPDSNFDAHGYYVSPFDAPRIITPSDLILSSTKYARYSEFVNQNLGLTSEDAAESITLHDLNLALTQDGMDLVSSSMHHMGIDVGLTCYISIGRMTADGHFLVVYRERCVIGDLETRKRELQRKYKVLVTVIDSQPYVDVVQRLQKADRNLYGGVYSTTKKLEAFSIRMFEGEERSGKLPIHTAQINRDKCFDLLMGVIKRGEMLVQRVGDEEDELFMKHMLDMRRVQVYDEHMELTWTWSKSKAAQDHYHHSTLYLFVASQLSQTAMRNHSLAGVPIFRKFQVKSNGPVLATNQ
jgi:hypothetical protein